MKLQKYYIIEISTCMKEIGAWKQLDVPIEYYKTENNFTLFKSSTSIPEQNPIMDNFILKSRAKLTDVLSCEMIQPSIGMFISEKMFEILQEFKLSGVKFYDTSIIDKKGSKIINYKFMFFYRDFLDKINFEESIFIDFTEDDKQVTLLENEKTDFPGFYEPKQIVFKEEIDLMKSPYDIKIIVSEKLYNKLIELGITGGEFEENEKVKYYVE